jgi:hypothetical protein
MCSAVVSNTFAASTLRSVGDKRSPASTDSAVKYHSSVAKSIRLVANHASDGEIAPKLCSTLHMAAVSGGAVAIHPSTSVPPCAGVTACGGGEPSEPAVALPIISTRSITMDCFPVGAACDAPTDGSALADTGAATVIVVAARGWARVGPGCGVGYAPEGR